MIKFPGSAEDKRFQVLAVITVLVIGLAIAGHFLDRQTAIEVKQRADAPGKEAVKEGGSETGSVSTALKEQDNKNDKIYVHLTGAVEKPGVLELEEGSRLFVALKLAQVKADVAYDAINLAEILVDGQQYHIPSKGELLEGSPGEGNTGIGKTGIANAGSANVGSANKSIGANAVGSGTGLTAKPSSLINVNTADSALLESLPGIGPAMAERIIQYRREQGRFRNIDELKNVSGIGEKKFEQIKPYVRV